MTEKRYFFDSDPNPIKDGEWCISGAPYRLESLFRVKISSSGRVKMQYAPYGDAYLVRKEQMAQLRPPAQDFLIDGYQRISEDKLRAILDENQQRIGWFCSQLRRSSHNSH